MEMGTRVRFTSNSRFNDWRKGEQATIQKVLAVPPLNLNTLVVIAKRDGVLVWATDADFEVFEQLPLF